VRELNPLDDPEARPGPPEIIRDDLVDVYGTRSGTQIAAEFADEENELNAVLAEAGGSGGGGSVVVRKLNSTTRKFEWLAKYTAADFVAFGGVSFLATKFGGGEYELLVYGVDNRIMKRPKITIAAAAIAEPKTGDASAVDKLANAMLEGFKNLQMQIQQAARPPESRESFMREMLAMKEFFGGGSRQESSLDMLAKILPIVRDMVPREGDTNLLDVMGKLATEFGPAIRDAVSRTPALAAPGMAAATPATVIPPTPEQIGANQMQLMLKAQLIALCREAAADSDPAPYAAIIVTKVNPEILNKMATDPNWLAELGKIHSGVTLFPKWFGELRECVLEEMQPEADELPSGNDSGESDGENMPV
jgi:hypothetical protein